jgi:hypothetical protein
MSNPLFGSCFELPAGENLGVGSLYYDNSFLKASSILANSVLNSVSSTSSNSPTSSSNTLISFNDE